MPLPDPAAFTRRQFLHSGLVMASAAATLPAFLQRSAFGLPMPALGMSSIPGVPEDHILVVLQLSGGNDGLNTVIPIGEDEYYRRRQGIAITHQQAIRLDSRTGAIGLHPALAPIKEMYDDGIAAIIQGVGYPNPNRSHFKSMDIWHTADTSGIGDGWLGRYYDSQCCGYGKGESGTPEATQATPQPGIAIGRRAPLAMQGRRLQPIAFETPALFRWTGQDVHESLNDPYRAITTAGVHEGVEPDSPAAFLMRTALDAQVSSDLIRRAVAQRPLAQYPNSAIARDLAMIASMIRAGLKTRVYYCSLGGFDTHAGQGGANGQHANLLRTFAEASRAFYADLKAQENDKRVMTIVFSEFGRRVGQNASGGTDHGTAAPMFILGPMARAGLHGEHPSMRDLDDGDLKFRIDFRQVYATVLEHWMGAPSKEILEGNYRTLNLLRT